MELIRPWQTMPQNGLVRGKQRSFDSLDSKFCLIYLFLHFIEILLRPFSPYTSVAVKKKKRPDPTLSLVINFKLFKLVGAYSSSVI